MESAPPANPRAAEQPATETRTADPQPAAGPQPAEPGQAEPALQLRAPAPDDGAEIWELVRDSGMLDLNSSYAYLMLTRNFADTSVVADLDGELVGFVLGYLVPDDPSALFVWQVGVAEQARGTGIATSMLEWLLDDTAVTHLEATVGPDNTASQNLFRSIARTHDADVDVSPWIHADDFPDDGHAPEHLFRIGPLAAEDATTNTVTYLADRQRDDAHEPVPAGWSPALSHAWQVQPTASDTGDSVLATSA